MVHELQFQSIQILIFQIVNKVLRIDVFYSIKVLEQENRFLNYFLDENCLFERFFARTYQNFFIKSVYFTLKKIMKNYNWKKIFIVLKSSWKIHVVMLKKTVLIFHLTFIFSCIDSVFEHTFKRFLVELRKYHLNLFDHLFF